MMKYPADYIGKIIKGDCLEMMKDIPDKSIDLVITDPPYGIQQKAYRINDRSKLAKTKDYGNYEWDKKRMSRDYLKRIFAISKNQIIFGGNCYADWLPPSSCWLVWDKDNTGGFADCELIWTSFTTAVRKVRWRWNGMIQEHMDNKEKREHPTQKPLEVLNWIIKNYSQEGDIILDPFAGSGTTLVAAEGLNRKWIGIEKEQKYCVIARQRLSEVQKEMFT